MALGPGAWASVRTWLTRLLTEEPERDRGRAAPAAGRARSRCTCPSRGRLRRLLLLDPARDQRRPDLPPRRRGAAAELEAPARGLPRPRRHRRRLRYADPPPDRPGSAGHRRRAARIRAEPPPRHRGRARLRRRHAEHPRTSRCRPSAFADHVFGVAAAQRLVRPRHPGLGVRPARAVPRQVVRHLDLGLGHPAGRPRGRPGAAARPGPRARWSTSGSRSRPATTSRSRCCSTARWSAARRTPRCTGHPRRCSPT